jgi:hypothetical protein
MSSNERQRVERLPGSRRARLTAAPGTTAEPRPADDVDPDPAGGAPADGGPNDARMRRDVPPHY